MSKLKKVPPKIAAEIAQALVRIFGTQTTAAEALGVGQGTITEYVSERSAMGLSTYKAAMRLVSDHEERLAFLARWFDYQARGRDRLDRFGMVDEERRGHRGRCVALKERNISSHAKRDIHRLAVDITDEFMGWGMLVNGDALVFYTPLLLGKGGTIYRVLYMDRPDVKPMAGAWTDDPLIGIQ